MYYKSRIQTKLRAQKGKDSFFKNFYGKKMLFRKDMFCASLLYFFKTKYYVCVYTYILMCNYDFRLSKPKIYI